MLTKPITCVGCPLYEGPCGKKVGFSLPDGNGTSGVMVVAEALGESEELAGRALVGKSGHTLFQQLARVGVERDSLTLYNVVACRPPDNKLIGMWYEKQAIEHCRPNLDAAISKAKDTAAAVGKTFVIVTLGVSAFKRVLGFDHKKDSELLKRDYYSYPFWSDHYSCWVLNAPHPAFLVRGKTHLWPVVQFVFKRALEIADHGLQIEEPDYTLDPSAFQFELWARGYFASLADDPDNPLSYDIETPYKKKKKDEEEIAKDDEGDHTILRISFSYFHHGKTYTTSVKWSVEYMAVIEQLFAVAKFTLGWNSMKYDRPRVTRYVKMASIELDGMVAWHFLNTSLPMNLCFVTPYYWQNTAMWKHLSDVLPAYYNAKDADAALRNYMGIKRDLIANGLWGVWQRHWIELSKALKFMTDTGVLRDNVMRDDAEVKLSAMLDEIEVRMEAAIPVEARKFKVYKKVPKVITDDMVQDVISIDQPFCATCGLAKPKRWKKHITLCGGAETKLGVPETLWKKPLPFKISKVSLIGYQQALKHQAIRTRKERKITFDADAITMLVKQHKQDKLYPTILEHRKVNKLLGTYIGHTENGVLSGGMPVGPDGRIHTVYGRNASTLRFTSEDPNLQNLPRPNPKDPNDIVNIIRNLVVAQEGSILYARDFSGIEAVLTGYFAMDPSYIRLARRDIHTYYTAYALHELEGGARIKAADLPDINWPDDRLFPYLEQLKSEYKYERNSLYKHLVHAANFQQSAKGAQEKIFSETGIDYPVSTVQRVMDVYYNLFPKIRQWHHQILDEAEKENYLRNPFGYVHRFSKVYDYHKEFGQWVKKPGPDSNKAIAFKPQSTAVAIITEAILRLYFTRFEEAGQYLRLQVHDELLFECPTNLWQQVDSVVREEMEAAIPEMPMPASWGLGSNLNILTEAKLDLNSPSRWGSMKGNKLCLAS